MSVSDDGRDPTSDVEVEIQDEWDASPSDGEDEEAPRRDANFDAKRKAHYNMGALLKKAQVEDESDEETEQEPTKPANGIAKSEKRQKVDENEENNDDDDEEDTDDEQQSTHTKKTSS